MKTLQFRGPRTALLAVAVAAACLLSAPRAFAQAAPAEVVSKVPPATIAAIRDEGLNRSQVMNHLDYLCNVIGPRLTASPGAKAANDWTKDTLAKWGLDAKIEPWEPFGRGWYIKSFHIQVTSPQTIVLNGIPKAWSPGFDQPFEAPIIHVTATSVEDLEKFRGKLKDAIVLIGNPRNVPARFEPLATRRDDAALERMANAPVGATGRGGGPPATDPAAGGRGGGRGRGGATTGPATQPDTQPAPGGGRGGRGGGGATANVTQRAFAMAFQEGAKLVIDGSNNGDGGTIFVTSSTIPQGVNRGDTGGAAAAQRVYSATPPAIPPQVTLAVEDFNRLARMAAQGVEMKAKVDLQVGYVENATVYNTVAEIPGTDLKDQVVMLGAHLDSWHVGTGATDNGAGCAAMMEAMRIISTLKQQPRRTIRIALWTGEEEGLLGSRAYVRKHFGNLQPAANRGGPATAPGEGDGGGRGRGGRGGPQTLVKLPDYDKLQAYFNLDNGTGKVRGINTQANPAVAPYFREWIKPFADLDAKTVANGTAGSTDHIAFDDVGLPGYNFIQDPIEYSTRTHHSTADVYDRIQAADMRQASTIIAAFVWQAANMDERLPRKPEPGAARGQ